MSAEAKSKKSKRESEKLREWTKRKGKWKRMATSRGNEEKSRSLRLRLRKSAP
jgi:hypothetical protein